ncbi:MAG: hemolysin family protein [Chloroflexi bacterium]|nr:hemolysin family protein [Chloroflexota bacterium]
MEAIFPYLVILLLILLNGMFVAAEFAIIGVRPTRIEQLAEEGNVTARRLRKIVRDPAEADRYIASAQLGITIASLGLGMYGEPVIAHIIEGPLHDWFGIEGDAVHTISFFFALTVITYLHVVVGEMVPKSLALQNAERAVFALAAPMALMQRIFAIPIRILNNIGMFVLRLLRVKPPSKESLLTTANDLELIVSESVVGGLVEANEQALIRNIFDFSELHAGQIMTPRTRMDAVPVDISHDELAKKLAESHHSRLPVYEGSLDNIIGVIYLKDFVRREISGEPFDMKALIHDVPFIPEQLSADELLKQLKQRHIHIAIVVDEYGGTAGLVTLEDLIEEVTGEIRDEFDTDERPPITVVGPGHIIALGSVRLDEIAEYVPIADDEHDVESIGGLVLALLNASPSVGDEIKLNGTTLRVEEVNGLTVESVSVRYDDAKSTEDWSGL